MNVLKQISSEQFISYLSENTLNMKIRTKYDKIIDIKKSTDQYGKQEAEQFQGSAYVVEIRLVVLHRGQEFVEPG